MNLDPAGLAIALGLMLPIAAAIGCVIIVERRRPLHTRTPERTTPERRTVDVRIGDIETTELPPLPVSDRRSRLMPPERLEQRDWPTNLPEPRPELEWLPEPEWPPETLDRLPVGRIAFAHPDLELMQRVVEGLRNLPPR